MSDPVPITVNIPPDFQHLLNQVQATTNALHCLGTTWINVADDVDGPNEDGDFKTAKRPDIDGGVKMAIEHSIVRTLSRLDAIMDDNARWPRFEETAPVRRFISESTGRTKMFSAQRKAAESHNMALQAAQLPHRTFHPTFHKVPDGFEARYCGENFTLVGRGPSLADALDDFDQAFVGLGDHQTAVEYAQITDEKTPGTDGSASPQLPVDEPDGGSSEDSGGTRD